MHTMIAGQTHSGKSYLLHVLITGLAARYPPDELRFILVDGKQGVEFKSYRRLPHADVVCLRTSSAIARSVLADYFAEMNERFRLFQSANVRDLEEYRRTTGNVKPRMLMIVDEYQQLLTGDADRSGSLLLQAILRKGARCGYPYCPLFAILSCGRTSREGHTEHSSTRRAGPCTDYSSRVSRFSIGG